MLGVLIGLIASQPGRLWRSPNPTVKEINAAFRNVIIICIGRQLLFLLLLLHMVATALIFDSCVLAQ